MTRELVLLVAGLGLVSGQLSAQEAVPINVQGAYTNVPTGLTFPETVAEFRRQSVARFDADAAHIGAIYRWTDGNAGVSMMARVYPIPEEDGAPWTLEHQFEGEQRRIRASPAGQIDISVDEMTLLRNRTRVSGRVADFAATQPGSAPMSFRLYLFQQEGWSLRFLASFPEASERAGRAAAERFIDAFSWDGMVARRATGQEPTCVVVVSIADLEHEDESVGAWLGYAAFRTKWREDHPELAAVAGPEPPGFEEEAQAREYLLELWNRIDGSDDRYLEALTLVHEAGYLREYVHHYLVRHPDWVDDPPARLAEFHRWRARNLASHEAITLAGIDCK